MQLFYVCLLLTNKYCIHSRRVGDSLPGNFESNRQANRFPNAGVHSAPPPAKLLCAAFDCIVLSRCNLKQ